MRIWLLASLLACRTAAAGEEAVPFGRHPEDDAIFGAMKAEMDRSLKSLRLDAFGPPYFLAYRLVNGEEVNISAAYGAVTKRGQDKSRALYVEARYGDHSLDNTDLEYNGWHSDAAEDPAVLRQELWNMTDSAYKAAVAGYLDKKAKKATELEVEKLTDFSMETPVTARRDQPSANFRWSAMVDRITAASREFRKFPFVNWSDATVAIRSARRYLLTSEGTRIATPQEYVPVILYITVWGQAPDGMQLMNETSWAARTEAELPDVETVRKKAAAVAAELGVLRGAPVQSAISAPVIMDPEFTGVFFHEALGHKLEGQRQRDPNESQIFRDRVGTHVIPDFLSVVDDPTMKEFKGQPLHGHYEFDDEGVLASRVVLVDRGVLKNFLNSRWPIKGFARSNGHGRSEKLSHPTGRMSNLMVLAHQPVPFEELKRRLLVLCRAENKPYGFILRGSHGGENPTNRRSAQTLEVQPRLVYRVDAKTGEETLVRGVKMVGTPLVVLNRIVAAGDDPALANPYFCGAESGSVPVNQIAPSVLVSEVELQRLPEDRSRPPILPIPFTETEKP
ncbi:MAG: TldD/PmbA family protein [Elusimicrobia bacterium]|nr:TldD/PmbA family protein [Elusimicrobiota bacterium]